MDKYFRKFSHFHGRKKKIDLRETSMRIIGGPDGGQALDLPPPISTVANLTHICSLLNDVLIQKIQRCKRAVSFSHEPHQLN